VPFTGTGPTLLMLTLSAFSVDHARAADSPVLIFAGVATKEVIFAVGIGAGPTVTVTDWVTVLPFPEAVRTNVVVTAGETETVPAFVLTEPTPEIVTASAFSTVQASIEDWPEAMEAGFAEKDVTPGSSVGGTVTVMLAVAVTSPAGFFAVKV